MRGATGRLLLEFSSALSEEGYDVTVLTTGRKASISRDKFGIEIIRVKTSANARSMFSNFVISMKLFLKALFMARPDVIITKTDPPLFVIFGSWLAFLKRTKHIHWCQDLYPDILPALNYRTSSLTYKIMDSLSSKALRKCQHVVTIASCMRDNLLKKGLSEDKVTIIPNWYDGVLNKDADQPKQEELPMKFRILYAGNMGRAHPAETLFQAAEILHETDPDIEFLFVGNSPRIQSMAIERSRKGMENIRFLPFQPRRKLRPLLESGDIHLISMSEDATGCILPSRIYDIFEIQRPCIFVGPATSELSIILDDYQAGITIPQGQGELLANAIRHLRDHGEDWCTLYEGAGEARKVFTPQGSLELWKEVLKDI